MQIRHPVVGVSADTSLVRHAHVTATILIDERHPYDPGFIAQEAYADLVEETRVDLVNDLEVSRQDLGEYRYGPVLQCLRQQRMVGIGKGPARDRPGSIPIQRVLIHEEPQELGKGKGWLFVVLLFGFF